jgi:transposase
MISDKDIATILRLAPFWTLFKSECDHKAKSTHLWIIAESDALICPICRKVCPIYDHLPERIWRHLDLCDYKAFLHAKVPRVSCPEHGVHQVFISWADPRITLTHTMECRVQEVLRQTKTVLGAARLLDMSWDQVHGVMNRGVARGILRRGDIPLEQIAVDEKALLKGQNYVTLIYDLQRSAVIDVIEDRTKEGLEKYWKSLGPAILSGVVSIAMDMWQPYITATMECIPEAQKKIVHDRFHIAQHMGKAVDDTRIEEHRKLKASGDESLKGTKFWWLYGQEKLSDVKIQALNALVAADLKTGQAWILKEQLRHLWTLTTVESAKEYGLNWAQEAMKTGLKSVKKVANLVTTHIDQIANYARHGISTGKAEGINSVVMAIKRAARGYRTWESFRIVILFFCGKLDTTPRSH